MKRLIFINGTMGAGKTAVSRELLHRMQPGVFLDGDWCWMAEPFLVNTETKEMVQQNIAVLLQNFLRCSAYENVIFCWVMQEKAIGEEILRRLEGEYRFYWFTLTLSEQVLRERLERDIQAGIRERDVIERSVARIPCYEKMDTQRIDVSRISPAEAAAKLAEMIRAKEK
jgi:hypothetical protein